MPEDASSDVERGGGAAAGEAAAGEAAGEAVAEAGTVSESGVTC
jgi:hypothetical protein